MCKARNAIARMGARSRTGRQPVALLLLIVLGAVIPTLLTTEKAGAEEFSCDDVVLDLAPGTLFAVPPGRSFALTFSVANDSPDPLGRVHMLIGRGSNPDLFEIESGTILVKDRDGSESDEYPLNVIDMISQEEWINLASRISPGRSYTITTVWRLRNDAPAGTWAQVVMRLEADTIRDGSDERINCTKWTDIFIRPPLPAIPKLLPIPYLFVNDTSPSPGDTITVTAAFRNPGVVVQTDLVAKFWQASGQKKEWLTPVLGSGRQEISQYWHVEDPREGVMVSLPLETDAFALGDSFTIREINPGMVWAFTFKAKVHVDAEIGRQVTSTVCISGDEGIEDAVPREDCEQLSLAIAEPPARAEASLMIDSSRLAAEGPVVFNVTVRNYQDTPLSGAALRVSLPKALKYESGTAALAYGDYLDVNAREIGDDWLAGGLALPMMLPGGRVELKFHAWLSSSLPHGREVAVSASLLDGRETLSHEESTLKVHKLRRVVLEVGSPDVVSGRGVINYLLRIENGGQSLSDAVLAVALSPGLEMSKASIYVRGLWHDLPKGWIASGYRLPALTPGEEVVVRIDTEAIYDLASDLDLSTTFWVVDATVDPIVRIEEVAVTRVDNAINRSDLAEIAERIDDPQFLILEVGLTIVGTVLSVLVFGRIGVVLGGLGVLGGVLGAGMAGAELWIGAAGGYLGGNALAWVLRPRVEMLGRWFAGLEVVRSARRSSIGRFVAQLRGGGHDKCAGT